MIKNYFTLLFILFFGLNLSAQEAPEVQKSLITKITATWCPPCGGWGWDLFHNLVDDNSDKALAIANHYSGDLANNTAESIADNLGASSQPRFYLGNLDQNATSGTAAAKRMEVQNAVDANYLLAPVVNAGIEAILDGSELTVNTKTHFFQDAEGEFYINAYIVEDGVVNFQATQGADAIHENVLRTGIHSDFFGEPIIDGAVTSGTEFSHTFVTNLNTSWELSNLTVAIMIWQKNNTTGTYTFINTNSTNTFGSPVKVVEISSDELNMQVQPTVSNGNTTLTLDVVQAQKDLQIDIFNQLGQLQNNVFSGSANTGIQTFEIGNDLEAGIYNVVARIGDRVSNVRFIVQ